MLTKPEEIVGAVGTFQTDTNFLRLQRRWDDDYSLWRLKPYDAGKGYISYTSNYPRILADKIISMLVEAELLLHVPEDLLTDEEATRANNVERLLYGSFNINDGIFARNSDTPTLREQFAWYAIVRGATCLRIYVYKNDKGETVPEIMPWDIYNVSYGRGEHGIDWAGNSYKITGAEAKAKYELKKGATELIDCIDFCDTEKYGLIVDGGWAGGSPTKHGLGYCPVFIIRAGATPIVWMKNYDQTMTHVGESVFSAIRDISPINNKTMSDYLTIVRRGVKPPLGLWSADGQATLDEDIFQVEKGAIIPMRKDMELRPIMKETMPVDAAPLANAISGELQRGGLPHTAWGELGFRLSGFAVNTLHNAMMTLIIPFSTCLERTYKLASTEILSQYQAKPDLPTIKVRGRTSQNTPFGFAKPQEIKQSDIKGDWEVEVKLEPVLPQDDAAKYALANMAREGDVPLLSTETIRGQILGVRDPDLEAQKVAREWGKQRDLNKLWAAYKAALYDGDVMEAQNLLVELNRILGVPPQGAPRGGGVNPASIAAVKAAANRGTGIQTPTGMPPQVQPPEAGGGLPAGAAGAKIPAVAEEE